MNTIEQTLSSLSLGEPQRHRNLAMFPLLSSQTVLPAYRMLDEALAQGAARVTEVTEGGSVPELAFDNAGLDPVLLVDGEELEGARQNRILNITILVGAGKKLVIPVSCVERGRWAYAKRHFDASDRVLFAKARAAKHAAVSASMAREGVPRSDQASIWSDIDERFASAGKQSRTAAMSDLYEAQDGELAAYERAFQWQPGQVGAVFAIDGGPVAVELFDASDTFRKFLRKAVGSFAMDAVAARSPRSEQPSADQVNQFLARVQASAVERFPATGEGEDLRLSGEGIVGGALQVQDRAVHLSVFRTESDGGKHVNRLERNRGYSAW